VDVKLFNEHHALIVRLGKDFCKTKPLCSECPLSYLNRSKKHRYIGVN
jgi:endonuclease-3 related protein